MAPYPIYQLQDSLSLFYYTGEPAGGDNPGGVAATSNCLQHQQQQLAIFLSHLIGKGVIQKITAVYPTVASTGIFLLFPSFFALTRIPTTFSRPTSQGTGFLHTSPPPARPLGPAIGTLTIRDGRGCGLAQAIRAVERGGLDLWSLTETRQTEMYPNNWRG